MNLETALLDTPGKTQTEIIATYIGEDQSRFDQLMTFLRGDATSREPLASRAARVMWKCTDRHPDLILPHLDLLVALLGNGNLSTALKRHCTRVLESVPYPPDLLGPIYECCFQLLADPDESIAVRVFSMTTISNICELEPELADEVILLIREHLPYGSPAYRARAKRELARLEKLKE